MKKYDVIIIGAGAAGLMCAIEAGKRRRRVAVLDHANKPGKKILMSGGGRCNFTNLHVSPENFISHNPNFCKSALSRYTPSHFIDLVEKHQIPYHEKTLGQLFCDHKSKAIVDLLLQECKEAFAELQLETSIQTIERTGTGFELQTSQGKYQAESVVVATGGLSIPTLGASPLGYQIATQFGLKVFPTRAGLVPFTLHVSDKEKSSPLSGVALDCEVSCRDQSFRENLLFTHRGLSGPAILQISSYWQAGDSLSIKLIPDSDLFEELKSAKRSKNLLLIRNFLSDYFPKRVISTYLSEDLGNQSLQDCSDKQLEQIAACFQAMIIKPNGTEGYRTAEVTLGGVDCDAISSKTFETKSVNGLYFVGEVLDVTGWLGGYNFQWAWASGYAAGQVA